MFDAIQCVSQYSRYKEIYKCMDEITGFFSYDFHIDITFKDTNMKWLRLLYNRKENFVQKAIKVIIEIL